MSLEVSVYLPHHAMPAAAEWASSIAQRGFDATLDPEFDVVEFSGWLRCKLGGADAGFEYDSGPIEFIDELELPPNFDFSVTFTAHADGAESASCAICAAVLCAEGGGVLVDPQLDVAISADDAVGWAREQLAQVSA